MIEKKYIFLVLFILLAIGCTSKNKLSILIEGDQLQLKNETNADLKHFIDPLIFEVDIVQYSNYQNQSISNFMLVLTDSMNRKYLLCGAPHKPPYNNLQRLPVVLKNNSSLSFDLPDPIYYNYCNELKKPLYWQILYVETVFSQGSSSQLTQYRILHESNKIQISNSSNDSLDSSVYRKGSWSSQIFFNAIEKK